LDKSEVREIHRYALSEADDLGMQPWIDDPDPRLGHVPTLNALSPFGGQIKEVIHQAAAIIFILGWTGLGPYQESVEAKLIQEELAERARSGSEVHFVPILLRRANPDQLPAWMHTYTVVNRDTLISDAIDLWAGIKLRLKAPVEPFRSPPPEHVKPPPPDAVATILDAINDQTDQPCLTLFIGPYATPRAGGVVGPMELTETLLERLGIGRGALEPLPPWPSEAAQWARICGDVRATIQAKLRPNSLKPEILETSIADLAHVWSENKPRGRFGYNGLTLLTTRIDLGLEFELARNAKLKNFTRFLPTAWGSRRPNWENYVIQQWHYDHAWRPDPPVWTLRPPWDPEPCDPNGTLNTIPLEKFHSVVLIKLCGSLDLPDSLMLTISDFFEKQDRLENIPSQLRLSINTSPQILLGCGFASPLAQLVRLKLLDGAGNDGAGNTGKKRILVMPQEQPMPLGHTHEQPMPLDQTALVPHEQPTPSGRTAPARQDALNMLEMRLVRERLEDFKDAFGVNELYRAEQHNFIDRLAAGLKR
jgi:hypothetical protein